MCFPTFCGPGPLATKILLGFEKVREAQKYEGANITDASVTSTMVSNDATPLKDVRKSAAVSDLVQN